MTTEFKKKAVRLSSLGARFYIGDGWTLEELNECLINGSWKTFPEDDDPYYILDAQSRYDVEKLLLKANKCVSQFSSDYGKSVRELLEDRNW